MYKLYCLLIAFICCSSSAVTHYVDLNSTNPVLPYTSWNTAATNIQDAVDATVDGDIVMVAEGHYYPASWITVTKKITVQSVSGPKNTIVDGIHSRGCFFLHNVECVISGLTLTRGYGGRGVSCYYPGTLPVVTNCIFIANSGEVGGGMCYGTANNCTFIGNLAYVDGGGGMAWGIANNCLFIENSAKNFHREGHGGGMSGGTANNCTFVGNKANDRGGLSAVNANNCIIWHNYCYILGSEGEMVGLAEYNVGQNVVAQNCCSPDLLHGVDGNITNAPLFVDPENGDFRLQATSPCIDAGSNSYVSHSVDFAGNPRIMDGNYDGIATVDMGAYEFQSMMIPSGCIQLPTINLKSNGRTPVTIRSSETFDVSSIDPSSIRFANATPVHVIIDLKGSVELKLHFKTQDLQIDPADTEAVLIGQADDGSLVVGVVPVKIISVN